ncbi:hypothetical protein TSAR_015254 [Trichomalopsis sarcophagae]|uniref:Palmitoyltransferase n=1 Tax=Trichomalopsis sarcophagae TaxID=543379 RepID=A0A232F6Z0_9HYME|nr:hypothetical protein TSAR_015254 [Trichomalopsis sarcophagae]
MRLLGRFCCCREGSVRRISVDAVIPLFTVPLLTVIAAQNLVCTILVFLMSPPLVYYIYRNFLRFLMRTKFFLMWTITSVLMLMAIFEISVVPLLEILPEENYVFMAAVVAGLVCGYKTRQNADQVVQEDLQIQGLELGESSDDICNTCKRHVLPKTFHCRICQTCILRREYHCKWLDCCIGGSNLRWYMGCLFCSAVAFIYGSNLTMTTICHPFVFVGTVLLPDDCSDAYHQLDISICFVSSIYSLTIGLIVTFYFFYHLWLQYLGTTTNERRLLNNGNEHDKGILKNVIQFFCCKS